MFTPFPASQIPLTNAKLFISKGMGTLEAYKGEDWRETVK
jgi:hypothetical protein